MHLAVMGVVRDYLNEKEFNPVEVYLEGSQSIHRFHKPSESDDYDVVVVMDTNMAIARGLQSTINGDKAWLEQMCNASLDIKVVTEDYAPNEL